MNQVINSFATGLFSILVLMYLLYDAQTHFWERSKVSGSEKPGTTAW